MCIGYRSWYNNSRHIFFYQLASIFLFGHMITLKVFLCPNIIPPFSYIFVFSIKMLLDMFTYLNQTDYSWSKSLLPTPLLHFPVPTKSDLFLDFLFLLFTSDFLSLWLKIWKNLNLMTILDPAIHQLIDFLYPVLAW